MQSKLSGNLSAERKRLLQSVDCCKASIAQIRASLQASARGEAKVGYAKSVKRCEVKKTD